MFASPTMKGQDGLLGIRSPYLIVEPALRVAVGHGRRQLQVCVQRAVDQPERGPKAADAQGQVQLHPAHGPQNRVHPRIGVVVILVHLVCGKSSKRRKANGACHYKLGWTWPTQRLSVVVLVSAFSPTRQ